jgi:hypothetical protein
MEAYLNNTEIAIIFFFSYQHIYVITNANLEYLDYGLAVLVNVFSFFCSILFPLNENK